MKKQIISTPYIRGAIAPIAPHMDPPLQLA